MRRYLIIAATVIVALGILVGAYFYFFAGGAGVAVTPGGNVNLPNAGQRSVTQSNQNNSGVGPGAAPAAPVRVSPRLVQIDKGPVVPGEVAIDVSLLANGAIATTSTKGATTTSDVDIKYIERQSGNVFSYLVHAGTLTRTSNRTIPGIERALWLPDASVAFVTFLSGTNSGVINTYALPAQAGLPTNGSGGSSTQAGFFLPQNLSGISVSSTTILALASGGNGSVATLLRPDGTHATQAFITPLSSVRISFSGKTQYLVFTKPSGTLSGDAYLVDSGRRFSRVAGPLPGLVALASPSGKWVLVSYAEGGTMHLELVNASTGSTLPLPVSTIAEKCAWAPDESALYCGIPVNPPSGFTYPDDWYQGVVHFSDRIWKIDVAGRYAQLMLDFNKETKGALDATALSLDPKSSVLVFLNKNDGSLWSYQL